MAIKDRTCAWHAFQLVLRAGQHPDDNACLCSVIIMGKRLSFAQCQIEMGSIN